VRKQGEGRSGQGTWDWKRGYNQLPPALADKRKVTSYRVV